MPIIRGRITIANLGCVPDLATTCEMWGFYKDGRSCSYIAKLFKTTRQGVWDRFRRRGLPLRPSSRSRALPFIEFDGKRYAPNKDNYFRRTTRTQGTYGDMLHRAMWVKANGPIPKRHVVYFLDRDRMNCVLENLGCCHKNEVPHSTPLKLKPCLSCGRLMGKRATGNHPESPSAYAKRRTCGTRCSSDWKRGKRRGLRMHGNEHLAVLPPRSRTRQPSAADVQAMAQLEREHPQKRRSLDE